MPLQQRNILAQPEYLVRDGGMAVDCGCGDGKQTWDVHAVVDEKLDSDGEEEYLCAWTYEWVKKRNFNAYEKLAAFRYRHGESSDVQ